MATIEMDTSWVIVLVAFEIAAFWMWQWFYGEKTKIELAKGLSSLKTMAPTIKKQLKKAIDESLEEMDWTEILPEVSESGGMLQSILGNLDQVAGFINYMKEAKEVGKDVLEVGMKAASEVVKDEAKKKK